MTTKIERTDDDPRGQKLSAQMEKMGMKRPVKGVSSKSGTPKLASQSEKAVTQAQQSS